MMTRFGALCALLLLAGCLEATDLVEERVASPPLCTTPNGVAVCPTAHKVEQSP